MDSATTWAQQARQAHSQENVMMAGPEHHAQTAEAERVAVQLAQIADLVVKHETFDPCCAMRSTQFKLDVCDKDVGCCCPAVCLVLGGYLGYAQKFHADGEYMFSKRRGDLIGDEDETHYWITYNAREGWLMLYLNDEEGSW